MDKLEYKIDKKKDSLMEIKSTLPWESVSEEIEKSYRKIKKMVSMPGFRKGKVPMETIKSRFNAEAKSDFMESFAPKVLRNILEKENIDPVTTPGIIDFALEDGKPFELTLEVEVLPEVQLKKYKKLKIAKTIFDVTGKDVEDTISSLRERNASLKPKEGKAEKGDYAVVEFKAFRNEKEIKLGMPQHRLIEIGSFEPLPKFDNELIGLSAGEKKEFEYKFPKDFSKESLRNETAVFKVLLKDLKQREIPDVSKIAESMGLKDADELRKNIKESLESQAEQKSRGGVENQIVQELLEHHEIEIPDGLVNEDAAKRMKQAAVYVERQGGDPSVLEADLFKEKARNDIKAGLILRKIAEVEGIKVSEEDVKSEEDKLMETYAIKEREQVSRYVDKSSLLVKKVFDFIMENSKVKAEKYSEENASSEKE